MLVSYKWLQEYVEILATPEELADRLTAVGLAVETLHRPGREIKNVYTGEILKIDPHPNADKLVVCQVSTGGEEVRQIVTGATNVREGHIVPVAVEGARLAGGLVIKKAKLRGVESRGMLCSGQELGLDSALLPPEQARGIMILPPDTPLGLDICSVLGLDDTILELELTPNRGDCLSMLGVAREVAAIYGREVKWPPMSPQALPEEIAGQVQVEIRDPDLCRRYVAKLIHNVQIGPSPLWMVKRLMAAGIRSINNIVDITNYVMLEMGQPLHAFDYRTIKDGRIIVRRAAPGEQIVTLDGVTRSLHQEMLVIADPAGPVGIAGVMGGEATEVTAATTSILLESAYFDPVSIRRTAKALNLRSQASHRFERGVDITGCLRAAERAAYLMQQLAGGQVVAGEVDAYPRPYAARTIVLRPERVEYILGAAVPQDKIVSILRGLQFNVQKEEEKLLVTVPGHRPDISLEEDLVEEVARLYGYNSFPAVLPAGSAARGRRTPAQQLAWQVRDIMCGLGLSEVVTYSFISPRHADLLLLPEDSPLRRMLALQNPLSEEQSVMRTSMLPGLLEVLGRNMSRRVNDAAIFELGKVFYPGADALPEEKYVLAALLTGYAPGSWNSPARPVDFYYLKGILSVLLEKLHVGPVEYQPGGPSYYHPGRTATLFCAGRQLGVLGELHPTVLENYELSQRVVALEVDWAELLAAAAERVAYRPLPRFPGLERDLAVVVEQSVPAAAVQREIIAAGGKLLEEVRLFDVYQGEQVPAGHRSLAFALTFRAPDRTLSDEDVAKPLAEITRALADKFAAALRS
ncbi:phenylalanine--tRNA ligase subunit beta [Desulfurispora thermophila]|uniref:phenylalanine--tRNA ligase subunit beta n=1 Tax=Desulfurispora thermophila TaxID=265470 RepID=UPI00037AAA04|nr:phenylalanine--tRNA ligase subunit beta [Desulfurispora thermophila]